MKEKSTHLMGMNVYITNTAPEEVTSDYVHLLNSLRWQIEVLFKTWKSFFEIDECKTSKKNALRAYLYGQLIVIIICSSTMFKCGSYCLKRKSRSYVNTSRFL
jgi:IS4 transposase